jgi:hypothetical protein
MVDHVTSNGSQASGQGASEILRSGGMSNAPGRCRDRALGPLADLEQILDNYLKFKYILMLRLVELQQRNRFFLKMTTRSKIVKERILAEFVRLPDSMKGAVLAIMKFIKAHTGSEPTQEEVAEILKSYFILNEVGNQIKFQLKKDGKKELEEQINYKGPCWTLNLRSGPGQNMLAKAGVFHKSIQEAIEAIRQYMIKTTGTDPGYNIIAASLKSSFILSEIKNQMDYQRKMAAKKKQALKKIF